jgi:hypothetical protein
MSHTPDTVPAMDEQVADLKAALLVGLRVALQPDQGYQAFERHQLLAIRFHRAARTNATGVSERRGWCQYFEEHFPRGDEYAVLLWERWRNALLKDEYPDRVSSSRTGSGTPTGSSSIPARSSMSTCRPASGSREVARR